jgi:hypothetical protein
MAVTTRSMQLIDRSTALRADVAVNRVAHAHAGRVRSNILSRARLSVSFRTDDLCDDPSPSLTLATTSRATSLPSVGLADELRQRRALRARFEPVLISG